MGARLVRKQDGFGLVELIIAMTVMAVGIMAIVAGFSSGIVAVSRASRIATAGTLADKQMEAYRSLAYSSIGMNTSGAAPDSTYTGDSAYDSSTSDWVTSSTACSATFPGTTCRVQSPVTGPDGLKYRVDTYIYYSCATGTPNGATPPACQTGGTTVAEAVDTVTVVVRDGVTPSKTWFRETSTFDPNT